LRHGGRDSRIGMPAISNIFIMLRGRSTPSPEEPSIRVHTDWSNCASTGTGSKRFEQQTAEILQCLYFDATLRAKSSNAPNAQRERQRQRARRILFQHRSLGMIIHTRAFTH